MDRSKIVLPGTQRYYGWDGYLCENNFHIKIIFALRAPKVGAPPHCGRCKGLIYATGVRSPGATQTFSVMGCTVLSQKCFNKMPVV